MIRSDSIVNITKALVEAQKEFESAIKGRIVSVPTKSGGSYKFAYADLSMVIEATQAPLNNHGLAVIQAVNKDGEKAVMVETMLIHSSGEFIGTVTPLYGVVDGSAQSFGAAISYTRRYALKALLNLPEEDEAEQTDPKKTAEKPVELSTEQMDFCEKVRIGLEENLDGKQVDGPKLRDYLIASAKRTGKTVDTDPNRVNPMVTFILGKPDRIKELTGA